MDGLHFCRCIYQYPDPNAGLKNPKGPILQSKSEIWIDIMSIFWVHGYAVAALIKSTDKYTILTGTYKRFSDNQ